MTFDPRTQPPVPDGYIGDGSGPTGYLLKVNSDGSINTGGGGSAGTPSANVASVQGIAGGTPVPTIPGAPLSANILCGVSLSTGAVIAIPAGRTWVGTVSVSGEINTAAGSTAAVTGYVAAETSGTGVIPAALTSLAIVALAAPAGIAAGPGTSSGVGTCTVANVTVIAPVGNAVQIIISTSNTSAQSCIAVGALQ